MVLANLPRGKEEKFQLSQHFMSKIRQNTKERHWSY